MTKTIVTAVNVVKMLSALPFFTSGKIIRGFGRGSKQLGIPTANFGPEVVNLLPPALQTGIYYGWANIDSGDVHKMVISIGWNPFYDNKQRSMETHILHDYNCDLYGHVLKICITGYLRPEQNFESLDALISAIQQDISQAKELLDSNIAHQQLKNASYFFDVAADAHHTTAMKGEP